MKLGRLQTSNASEQKMQDNAARSVEELAHWSKLPIGKPTDIIRASTRINFNECARVATNDDAVTLSLPSISNNDILKPISVVEIGGGAKTITIIPAPGATINGEANRLITVAYGFMTLLPITKELWVVSYSTSTDSEKYRITIEGGYAIRLTNKTGAASIKGLLVEADTTTNDAAKIVDAGGNHCIGAMYDSGIADGEECWIVMGGIAEVLLRDYTNAFKGYWVQVSAIAGRADASASAAPGGGVVQLDEHMTEIGHCLQTVAAGANNLCRIILHFL